MDNNVINFPSQEEPAIEIERTEDYYKAAGELSECIISLPLNNADNDNLVALIMEQAKQAARGAFKQGFELGIKFCESKNEED